ncbi:GNAT family N-acetyltransferase [Glaciibacter superstes]|uniref:GNAT family N-acetyltransferase n=1 Tax=Glaciibacter superstes TaxID=501023 RepID=UPI0003B6D955|nr:GNAT family N-acetyltransferase [Glaciibacter superstes]
MAGESRPLSERVAAPERLAVPTHPSVARWRPATDADVDALWHLHQRIGEIDHPNHLMTRESLKAFRALSYYHPEQDSLVGIDSGGELIAHGMAVMPPRQRTLVRSILLGGVHPARRRRGIGQALFDWQIGRARQQLAASQKTLPGWIVAYADGRAPQNQALFERNGLALSRYFLGLGRGLTEPITRVQPADGIRLVPFSVALSAEIHAARDAAFADNWGSQPLSEEGWQLVVHGSTFRAELSFAALVGAPDDGEPGAGEHVVGFLLAAVNEGDWPHQGFSSSYISMVGVLAEWRGRHIASALLTAHLDAGRALGLDRATLDVDSNSPTGALDLYTGMGFARTHSKRAFVLEL